MGIVADVPDGLWAGARRPGRPSAAELEYVALGAARSGRCQRPEGHSEVVPGIRVRSPADATNPAWPGTAVRVSRPPVKWTKLEANVVELNPVSHRPPLPSLAR